MRAATSSRQTESRPPDSSTTTGAPSASRPVARTRSSRSMRASLDCRPVSFVTRSERDGVAVLTADRPPANAMNVEFLGDVVAAVDAIAADPPPALVLAGRPGFFSAGADLKAVPGYGPSEQ